MLPDTFYHIYNHANGYENLFRCDENYQYFLRRFAFYIHPVAETYAYCLMPNHFHILIKTRTLIESGQENDDPKTLKSQNIYSKAFADLFNSYTKAYNKRYKRMGSLFIHKFKRKEVQTDGYFAQLIRYIHNNPVHHRFVNRIDNWPYSSYASILSEKETLLNRREVLEWFEGKDGFIRFHANTGSLDKDFEFEE